MSLIGERGRVRELWDFGERTLPGLFLVVREATRGPVVVAVLFRLGFFGLQSGSGWWTAGSFSLSDRMAISELRPFVPFIGDGWAEMEWLAAEDGTSRGTEGRGWLISDTGTSGSALVVLRDCGISLIIPASVYLARSSPIFAFLRLIGIRLIRRSIRDRRSVA
jgi:hypothetical protein